MTKDITRYTQGLLLCGILHVLKNVLLLIHLKILIFWILQDFANRLSLTEGLTSYLFQLTNLEGRKEPLRVTNLVHPYLIRAPFQTCVTHYCSTVKRHAVVNIRCVSAVASQDVKNFFQEICEVYILPNLRCTLQKDLYQSLTAGSICILMQGSERFQLLALYLFLKKYPKHIGSKLPFWLEKCVSLQWLNTFQCRSHKMVS